jgi:hypothetical protein
MANALGRSQGIVEKEDGHADPTCGARPVGKTTLLAGVPGLVRE